MIWYERIWKDMIWYDMKGYDMIWYGKIWFDMIWYDHSMFCWLLAQSFTGSTIIYPTLTHRVSRPKWFQSTQTLRNTSHKTVSNDSWVVFLRVWYLSDPVSIFKFRPQNCPRKFSSSPWDALRRTPWPQGPQPKSESLQPRHTKSTTIPSYHHRMLGLVGGLLHKIDKMHHVWTHLNSSRDGASSRNKDFGTWNNTKQSIWPSVLCEKMLCQQNGCVLFQNARSQTGFGEKKPFQSGLSCRYI